MHLNPRAIVLIFVAVLVVPITAFEPEKSDKACVGECDEDHML